MFRLTAKSFDKFYHFRDCELSAQAPLNFNNMPDPLYTKSKKLKRKNIWFPR